MSISSIEPLPELFDDASLYSLRKELFKGAMNRHWEKVLELYRDDKVQGEFITRAYDTLLHVAVSSATENTVLDLLNILEDNRENRRGRKILRIKNKSGNTPLHLAVALGLEKVCRRIAKMCPDMVTSARNNLQETPLFSAVRHGKKNTFFVLEAVIHKEQKLKIINDDEVDSLSRRDITHCRGYDGNNILHYAIIGEQFDLAYEIIRLYPELVNYINCHGETALHILANKPSVFKSGAHFGLYEKIIYCCTITKPLEFQFVHFLENEKKNAREERSDIREEPSDIQEDENKVLPPTYKVCIDLFSLMKNSISCIFSTVASNLKSTSICKPCRADEENSYAGALVLEDGYKPSKRRMLSQKYLLAIFIFKIIAKLLSVIGIGQYWRGQTIAKLKQKHGNARQIMKKLVDHSTLWEYDEEASGGMKPAKSALSFDEIQNPPQSVETDQSYDIPNPSKDLAKEVGIDMEKNSLRIVKEKKSTDDILDPGETILINAIKKVGMDMMKKFLERNSLRIVEEKESTNRSDIESPKKTSYKHTAVIKASPVLVAAKNGITEMVERILTKYPVAIFDEDKDSKNIVLLAVEHRQVHVYDYLRSVPNMESVFWKLDKEGNSALHLAAMLSDRRLWSTGAALHIQWEIKWYKYVRSSMGQERSVTTNNAGKMPEEVFIESHDALIKDGITGLTNTCQSCSVVAALFATVAFQSVSTVPGGVDQQSGFPILSKRPVFQLFAISSLLALCFSVTSVVMFLAILISDFKVWDFERRLPVKLILGLTSLFMTIAFTLVAFCAGDFYVIQTDLKFASYPIYAIMCFPVTYFAVAQYPLYINLIKQTIKKIAKPEMVQGYIS